MDFNWPTSDGTTSGEKVVWDALETALKNDEGLCYYRYPIFSADRSRREPDFLLLHREWGMYVIECKSCYINNIEKIDGPMWFMKNWHSAEEFPYTQAEDQMYPILQKFMGERGLRRGRNCVIAGHTFIALPFITRTEWRERGFDRALSSPNTIIFADDLELEALRACLQHVPAEEKQGYESVS